MATVEISYTGTLGCWCKKSLTFSCHVFSMVLKARPLFAHSVLIVVFMWNCLTFCFLVFSTGYKAPIRSTLTSRSIPASSPFHRLHMGPSQGWDPMDPIQMVRTPIWTMVSTRPIDPPWMDRRTISLTQVLLKTTFRWVEKLKNDV